MFRILIRMFRTFRVSDRLRNQHPRWQLVSLFLSRHFAWCVGERALGNIGWLCIQERWNPEVVIILGTATCYRRATGGSSHDDVLSDNPALHTGALRPQPGFVESLFFISSHNGARAQVLEKLPTFSCISWACVFAGDGAAIFPVGSLGY